MYDPTFFYEGMTEKLRPGDIRYIKNWNAKDDSYWMILTSFCDLERRNHILLSKIKEIDSMEDIDESKRGMIKKYEIFYYFFLPELQDEFSESIVHYGMISPFSREMINSALKTESDCRGVISLSEDTRKLFQFHFANYITRDETLQIFKPYIEGFIDSLKK